MEGHWTCIFVGRSLSSYQCASLLVASGYEVEDVPSVLGRHDVMTGLAALLDRAMRVRSKPDLREVWGWSEYSPPLTRSLADSSSFHSEVRSSLFYGRLSEGRNTYNYGLSGGIHLRQGIWLACCTTAKLGSTE